MLRAPEVLAALSPLHVRSGLRASRTPSYEGCFVLQASGNGGCLFTLLRLSVEVETAVELALRILGGEPAPQPMPEVLLDGFNPSIVAEGNYVRKKVVEWFAGAKQARVVPTAQVQPVLGRLSQLRSTPSHMSAAGSTSPVHAAHAVPTPPGPATQRCVPARQRPTPCVPVGPE